MAKRQKTLFSIFRRRTNEHVWPLFFSRTSWPVSIILCWLHSSSIICTPPSLKRRSSPIHQGLKRGPPLGIARSRPVGLALFRYLPTVWYAYHWMKSTPAQGLSRFCQQWLSRSAEIIMMKPLQYTNCTDRQDFLNSVYQQFFYLLFFIIIILYFHEQLLP